MHQFGLVLFLLASPSLALLSPPRAKLTGPFALRLRPLYAEETPAETVGATNDAPETPTEELGFERPLDAPRLSAQEKIKQGDIGEAANDIVQLVKPRSDWWDQGPLSSPARGLASTDDIDPLDKFILGLPLPSYGLLGMSAFVAIAFIGCIFQLFYDVPAAPVLGVPLTSVIFALSGPTWIFLFIACIKKGQAETEAEDRGEF